MEKIDVSRDVREQNRMRSEALKRRFDGDGLYAVGLLGSPGSGKTTLLENVLPRIAKKGLKVAVIEGDLETDNDARRIAAIKGVKAVQINTLGACHLDADMVEKAYGEIDAAATDILIIENVGNLVCPVSFPVGERLRIAVISAAEGEDKPLKYPSAVLKTDALVITKTDIAKYVRVDVAAMAANARRIKPDLRIFFAGFEPGGQYVCADGDGALMEDFI